MSDGEWEYGQLYSGGGYLTFNQAPEIEEIYPLADRLRAGMRHGGHVYRRRVVVVSDWEEITEVPGEQEQERQQRGRHPRA